MKGSSSLHSRILRLMPVMPDRRAAAAVLLILPLVLAGRPAAGQQPAMAAAAANAAQMGVASAYGQLPLSFAPNVGQTDPQVRFLAQSGGATLLLTDSGAALVLPPQPTPGRHAPPATVQPPVPDGLARAGLRSGRVAQVPQAAPSLVCLTLLGANPHPRLVGRQRLPGTVNYFLGTDPRRWHMAIPTYAQVVYQNIYPGIDQVFYGRQGRLEYDFVVRPGADPAAIRLQVPDAALTLDRAGDLVLRLHDGVVVQEAPRVYQQTAEGRVQVASRYAPAGHGQVRVLLGTYDHRRALVIDPVLSYATYLGGKGNNEGDSIAVDRAGNAYVTGTAAAPDRTHSSDFPTTPGALQRTAGNAFVAKLNTTGTRLLYATYLGGTGYARSDAIAVDGAGNAYVTGYAFSTHFPTTPGALQSEHSVGPGHGQGGDSDAFVAKLNATGTALLYATYLGGTWSDSGAGIAVDGAGNAYITGQTYSPDFPTTPGALQGTYRGGTGYGHGEAWVARVVIPSS